MPITAADLDGTAGLKLVLQARQPMRVSVQLRVPDRGGLRWERSVYLDAAPRAVFVDFSEMRPIEADAGTPLKLRSVDSLLIVVDTVNALPGSAGECWIGAVEAASHLQVF
jgi:hypothetical protein